MPDSALPPDCPILIAGPTASGKSGLALRLAERDGGQIINADALQVYRCWRILTARPDADDVSRASHALYGHVDCAERYSVGAWLRDLAPILAQCAAEGARPILVGGTGLYLSAVTEGLAEIPEISPHVRALSEDLLRQGRVSDMLADLETGDPVTFARMDRANPMRVQRAWDVLRSTGRPLSEWQAHPAAPLIAPRTCVRIVLNPAREHLNASIGRRFGTMLAEGALEECARFIERGLPSELPAARALGAPELMAHLRGEITLAEATEAAVTATRRFAKRQRSWFRGRMADWNWFDPAEDIVARIRPR